MGASGSDAIGTVEQLRARITRLEQLLALHHIPVPHDAGLDENGLSAHLAFPELDFSEPERKPPERVDVRCAIEDFPHIAAALSGLWGKDGFDEYLGKLIVDERGSRKGFSMSAMEELLLLGRVARQRKALFGMFAEPKQGDVWQNIPEVTRRENVAG